MASVDSLNSGAVAQGSMTLKGNDLSVASSLPVIFYQATVSVDLQFTHIDTNAVTLLGLDPDDFSADANLLLQIIHDDDIASYRHAAKALGNGDPQSLEYRARNGDGKYLWFRDQMVLVGNLEDGAFEYTGCMIDISNEVALRRQCAETNRAYQELTERYHDAIESLVSGFCLTDKDDQIIAINTALAEAAGRDTDFFTGHPRRRLIQAILPKFVIFEGELVQQTEAWVDKIAQTMFEATGKSVEVKMTTGEWILITLDPASQGGQSAVSTDISLQKRVEEELRNSEVHFRTLVENQPLPAILVNCETGLVLYESPAASALFGREPNSSIPFHVQEMYAEPDERPKFISELRKHGELRDYPIHYQRPDGSTYWISINSKLITINDQEMHITSIMDLTEQRERENALKQANETLEDAIESLSEGFALFDQDSRLITFNSRYSEFNVTTRDLLEPGLLFEDLIETAKVRGEYYGEDEDVDNFLQMHRDADGNKKSVRGVEFRQRPDGRWLLYSSQLTRENGFVVTLNDVSDNKAMEKALRDSEEAVRSVLEASPTPITVSRVDDNSVLFESPASRELFQRSALGPDVDVREYWVNPQDRTEIWAELAKAGEVSDRAVLFRKGDGSEFWAGFSARKMTFQGADLIVSTVHDLTETRALQEEMSRQREVLHVSEKMVAMGELLASVSHELNNPLSVVVGQTQLLQETAEDPAVANRAERISKAADRCARIVKTFLAMARQQPRERVPADPNNLIDLALELTGYSLRGSNVTVSLSKASSLPSVRVDPDQITQVLTNLIVNAEQALRDVDGERLLRISSRFSAMNNEIIIKVKDNGPGIANDLRRRIFEPLFTTKEMGEGTGIGLALCHRLLEANGGKIKLASELGLGASFTIRLPVDVEDSVAVNEAVEATVAFVGLRVLVIDDEPDVAELISDILQLDGHKVVVADNGRTALEHLQAEEFEIILSDLRMPGYDGPWLFKQLRDDYPQMLDRIAFITGDTLSAEIASFLQESKRPYIEKPITPNDVRDLLIVLSQH